MLPAGSDGGPLRGFKDAQREAAFLRRFSADCAGSDCVVLLVGELLHCLATAKMAASGKLGAAPRAGPIKRCRCQPTTTLVHQPSGARQATVSVSTCSSLACSYLSVQHLNM